MIDSDGEGLQRFAVGGDVLASLRPFTGDDDIISRCECRATGALQRALFGSVSSGRRGWKGVEGVGLR